MHVETDNDKSTTPGMINISGAERNMHSEINGDKITSPGIEPIDNNSDVKEHYLCIVSEEDVINSAGLDAVPHNSTENNVEVVNELGESVPVMDDRVNELDEFPDELYDSPNNNSGDEETNGDLPNVPLYENAELSVQDALLLLMTLTRRHSMSDIALQHWLRFLTIILPQGHRLPSNIKEVKGYFSNLSRDIKTVYFCTNPQCNETSETHTANCASCGKAIKKEDYFVALPIEKQLNDILQGKCWQLLDRRDVNQ